MTGVNETSYVETEVLLAVMNDNTERANDLLAGMLPGELRTFSDQVKLLDDMVVAETRRRPHHRPPRPNEIGS